MGYFKTLSHLFIFLFLACALAGCSSDADAPEGSKSPVDVAMRHIEFLSETIGRRVAGSDNEAAARDYIRGEFDNLGFAVSLQEFEFGEEEVLASSNVVAVKPGIFPEEIIVGAHYDSVDVGKGATDNGSGIGLMLACAEELAKSTVFYTLRFVAFGAVSDNQNARISDTLVGVIL